MNELKIPVLISLFALFHLTSCSDTNSKNFIIGFIREVLELQNCKSQKYDLTFENGFDKDQAAILKNGELIFKQELNTDMSTGVAKYFPLCRAEKDRINLFINGKSFDLNFGHKFIFVSQNRNKINIEYSDTGRIYD